MIDGRESASIQDSLFNAWNGGLNIDRKVNTVSRVRCRDPQITPSLKNLCIGYYLYYV